MELLIENPNRFVLYPIKYDKLFEMYKKAEASFWTAEEIDMGDDLRDWETLDEFEKEFILNILGFFAASDGIVVENLLSRFGTEVQVPEARCFYAFQAAIENIHSETYSLMIQKFAGSPERQKELFHAIETHPATKKKAEWAIQFMTDPRVPETMEEKVLSFSKRLLAFACVEGIMFSSSFCALFWLKNKGKCPGLTFSNELISRDEGLHRDFAIELLKMCPRLPREIVLEIVKSAVDVELEFVRETLPTKLKNMNEESMAQYVKFVADHLLTSLGYEKEYKTKNPFFFMENISIDGKTNFFEKRVAEYSKAGVGGDSIGTSFNLNVDF
jgi:ribonucleoside-diphosphate reductase beta chain